MTTDPTQDLADLTDAEQVALLEQTPNAVDPDDEAIDQPTQDPTTVIEGDA